MKSLPLLAGVGAAAIISLTAGCSTWDSMSRTERGTSVGAGGGAVAGAVVAGPAGAVVGGVAGGVVGHEAAKPGHDSDDARRMASTGAARTTDDPAFVRSIQQALNDRGFNAGAPDGRWGPNTEEALRQFQASQGLSSTGQPDARTAAALGV
jgi:hypothetical protein